MPYHHCILFFFAPSLGKPPGVTVRDVFCDDHTRCLAVRPRSHVEQLRNAALMPALFLLTLLVPHPLLAAPQTLGSTGPEYALRWFTPGGEVALCGHATLAAAHALWEEGRVSPDLPIRFSTASGVLTCRRDGAGWIAMDFPAEVRPGLVEKMSRVFPPCRRHL